MKSLFRCALLFDFAPMCLYILSSNSDKNVFPLLINKKLIYDFAAFINGIL